VAASGSQIKSSKLGTRSLNGKKQVTYYGQPLYLYKGDTRPGTTKGEQRYQGSGAWFVISVDGRAIPKPGY
jgi:predicted lipoprotein with Yx(FWY)xxD motif